jgi:glycosyltransferase involved in cell wall biosynthesis
VTVSVVVRTYNESKHLGQLLAKIRRQVLPRSVELIVVDSGSTDDSVAIAEGHGARIVHIKQSDFTFGRSLNVGCAAASGDVLVFISGHCVPVGDDWLRNLTRPIDEQRAVYAYGRQVGDSTTRFSESQLFLKYFPEESKIPQEGFFANNANSAISAKTWSALRFDEQLTGLEDMEIGKRIVAGGLKIAYCADAPVYHLHDETWRQVKLRYEREAVALRHIMPEVHLTFGDFLRFFASAVLLDCGVALNERKLHRVIGEIVMFRVMQFWGSYRGNHAHRVLSNQTKHRYFYPR